MLVLYVAFIHNALSQNTCAWRAKVWNYAIIAPLVYDVPLVLLATVAAAVRSRDPRFLFQTWSHHVELRTASVA